MRYNLNDFALLDLKIKPISQENNVTKAAVPCQYFHRQVPQKQFGMPSFMRQQNMNRNRNYKCNTPVKQRFQQYLSDDYIKPVIVNEINVIQHVELQKQFVSRGTYSGYKKFRLNTSTENIEFNV